MNIPGVIFDLDGVICHTDKFHYLAWKKVCDERGFSFDEAVNNNLRGVSRMDSARIILEFNSATMTDGEMELFAGQKNAYYLEYLKQMSPDDLSGETERTLFSLREKGIKLAIGSSSRNTEFILKRIGLEGFFDYVADGNMISRSKPDPEVFLKAAEGLGLKPGECIVVEDARAGIDAAISGGFISAAIGKEAIDYGKADYNLSGILELLNIA